MTKVKVNPGVCCLTTTVEAIKGDRKKREVTVKVESMCENVQNMMDELGDTFNYFDVCLKHPGENLFYDYAKKNFPVHAACVSINGIIKCIEAECGLALPKNVSITFEDN